MYSRVAVPQELVRIATDSEGPGPDNYERTVKMLPKPFDSGYDRRTYGASGVPRKPKEDHAAGVTRRRVNQLAKVLVLRHEDAILA